MSDSKYINLAVVGAAHGIKGEVRVKTFTGDPLALGDYGPLRTQTGQELVVAQVRPAKDVVIVRFKGVETRNDAEALNGTELLVLRDKLPEPEEDEFYHVDLIGLRVETASGEPVGTIAAIHDFGAGEMLEVKRPGAKPALVPFTQAAVPTVDIKTGVVQVEPIAAGLVDDEDDGDAGRPDGEG
ncbi:ribosome maturation factor RimM [Tianweitania sediminis]|uniref:Ribosome maturation factor RimM n=1 Tax=Tianweitania sediminis TaxID=1502156 RepID=A0A8J7UHG6_9HYPH|nr:ribosome maturation factor RimM [Tianweitania sediminis]MBP0437793.1 ribosome maturation factor RimM [Tianweitania sediminis]